MDKDSVRLKIFLLVSDSFYNFYFSRRNRNELFKMLCCFLIYIVSQKIINVCPIRFSV